MKQLLIATAALAAMSGAAMASDCKVGMADYSKLRTGMTLAQVETALGCPGVEISASEAEGFKFSAVSWDGRGDLGANLMIMFNNGKLLSKSQFGLK